MRCNRPTGKAGPTLKRRRVTWPGLRESLAPVQGQTLHIPPPPASSPAIAQLTLAQSMRTPRVIRGAAKNPERRRAQAAFTSWSLSDCRVVRWCWKYLVREREAPTSCSGPSA